MRFFFFMFQLGSAFLFLGLSLDQVSVRSELPSLEGVFDKFSLWIGEYIFSEWGVFLTAALVVWGTLDYSIGARRSWNKKFDKYPFIHISGTVLEKNHHVEVSGSVVDGNGSINSAQHNNFWIKSADGKETKLSYVGKVGQDIIREGHRITAYFLSGNWVGVNNWSTDRFYAITIPQISTQLHALLIAGAAFFAFSDYGVTLPPGDVLPFTVDLAVLWLGILYITDRSVDKYRVRTFWARFNQYWDSVQDSDRDIKERPDAAV